MVVRSIENTNKIRADIKTCTLLSRGSMNIYADISSLLCNSVQSDILVKNKLCIPLERGSNVLSTG